jgi:AraC family transcriptional regulator
VVDPQEVAMSVLSRLSICSSDHDCPGGAALRAGKAQPPAIDLPAAKPPRPSPVFSLVDFRPASIFRRQIAVWCGLSGEFTRAIRREPFEVEYNGASHLMIAYETAQRFDGETIIDGLPRSTLRDISRKLVFVPAGLGFREWQEPSSLMSAIYLLVDPNILLIHDVEHSGSRACAPRLFFESTALWQTALKLRGLIETGPTASPLYAEALAVVLLHELLDSRGESAPRAHGGLAFSQRRAVLQYIEEHFAHEISLSTLASLAQLSPYHFLRAFKESFGVTPHRYHVQKRIERAKELIADRNLSLLQIAIELGFAEASSFSLAFRKIAHMTPSAYRRSLL